MKDELKKKKTIEKLKEIAKGLGPISDAVEIGKTKTNTKKEKETEKAATTQGVMNVNLDNSTKARAAQDEKNTAKRYEKVEVSPISSKGSFSSYTKYNTTPTKLTEDDKTQKSNVKSNLTKDEKIEAIRKGIELANKKKK